MCRSCTSSSRPKLPLEERFWTKVERRADGECWPWTARCDDAGYGSFKVARRLVKAHRIAWELTHGMIGDGLHVCHHCDNPPCCNPAHLFVGTRSDNMRDMAAKGRKRGGWPRQRIVIDQAA